MLKKFIYILFLIFMAGTMYGCAASKQIKVQAYTQDKERVDQELEGNAGYLSGTPVPEDRSQYKDTKKIYVLEFSKEAKEEDLESIDVVEPRNTQPTTYPQKTYQRQDVSKPKIDLPDFGDGAEPEKAQKQAPATSATYVEYTIEKDDSLQKISKKFYDSYGKWMKIYEANKDVIPNPDVIKPGTVIKIPMN